MRQLLLLACVSIMLSACYGGIIIVREIEVTRVVEITSTPLFLSEGNTYIVQSGDTPLTIATRFGITVEELIAANGLDNPDFVFSGQRLIIPGGVPASTPTPTPTAAPSIRIHVESPGNLLSEAVVLVNDSNIAINLQEWRLESIGKPTYTFDSISIFPGGNIWLHSRNDNDTSVALYRGEGSPLWRSGDIIVLVDSEGQVKATSVVP